MNKSFNERTMGPSANSELPHKVAHEAMLSILPVYTSTTNLQGAQSTCQVVQSQVSFFGKMTVSTGQKQRSRHMPNGVDRTPPLEQGNQNEFSQWLKCTDYQ